VCVCVCVCVSFFLLKISPYNNILSSRDAPIHSPFMSVLHRSPVVEHRSHVKRTSMCFRVAINNMRFTSPSRVDSTTKRERRCHDATSVMRTPPGQWGYLSPIPKSLEGVQQSRRSSPCSFHCAHVGGGLVGAIPPSSLSSSCRCKPLEGSKVEKMYIFLSTRCNRICLDKLVINTYMHKYYSITFYGLL